MNKMTSKKHGFTCYEDILGLEATPFEDQNIPRTTYQALKQGAAINPDGPALSFFASGSAFEKSRTLTHRELMTRVTQTANALRRLGVGRDDVVAYVLPNLPETHFTIWGGSAAGRVLAINPLLEPDQIADLLRAANTKVLVTLEKTPRTDLWEKCMAALPSLPSVQHVITASFLIGWMALWRPHSDWSASFVVPVRRWMGAKSR